MASLRVDEKRIRRTFEPSVKTWDDRALETPWEEITPPLSKATIFAMKNVFFFSHATTVQAAIIPQLKQQSHSAVVEAPTGCGKTLAFLIPLLERIVSSCDAHVAAHGKPILCRQIAGVVLSPSRVLAEQTYVVARNLAARFPYNIDVLLCDGVTQTPAAVKEHLRKASRGAGMVLVSTPADLFELLRLCAAGNGDASEGTRPSASTADAEREAMLAEQDEETLRRYHAKRAQRDANSKGAAPRDAQQATHTPKLLLDNELLRAFQAPNGQPMLMVIDEADVVLRADEMRATLLQLLDDFVLPLHKIHLEKTVESKPTKQQKKRSREEEKTSAVVSEESSLSFVDFGLFGATVGLSAHVKRFVSQFEGKCRTSFHHVIQRGSDFTKQLTNRHMLVPSYHLLHTLVQVINLHPQKKHFLFFNSPSVLLFVKALLQQLSAGKRPILFVNHIYAVYEGMKESTRFSEYNGFLQHTQSLSKVAAAVERSADDKALHKAAKEAGGSQARAAAASIAAAKLLHERKKKALSFAEEKNQHFQGGWKRDGRPPPGTGALLLCTDMAAFGLDVRDVDYVYHVEPPTSVRSYVHRIGRVGRMGMRGCSVLFLPWFPEGTTESVDAQPSALDRSSERKSTSTRFHTIMNTKLATSALQAHTVEESALDQPRKAYVDTLKQQHELQPYTIPPVAPISSTIRSVIEGDPSLTRMARQAAMALCKPPPPDDIQDDETDEVGAVAQSSEQSAPQLSSWYTPRLALETMLLD